MQAKTIDDVIQLLDEIIDSASKAQDRNGFFAALYRRVTVSVKAGIQTHAFENGERMEQLDVAFANRYFAAYSAYTQGQPLSESWKVAFDAARQPYPMLLQHLLLGMNAHINLDLGIAAATVAPQNDIQALKNDFFKINMVLASLVGECVTEFGKIWPVIAWANTMLDTKQEILVAYEIDQARNFAWSIALAFAPLGPDEWARALTRQDILVSGWGRSIFHPFFPVNVIAWWFNLTDSKPVADTIGILTEEAALVPLGILPGPTLRLI
ncbi:MAG TPA: DUF5995 family protein [Aggregatilineales bacterium]|nr:DUF5995 family protein [Aggregatilineales bacterium]